MAMMSGSNGGISNVYSQVDRLSVEAGNIKEPNSPVSYFINNECQLKCLHCYVGYSKDNGGLSAKDWARVFNGLIDNGKLIFGLVGKEPLLDWHKTRQVLNYLKTKRIKNNKIKLGLVTNGLLLNSEIINELIKIMPDYLDISLDGNQDAHDKIRGIGTYMKLMNNLASIPNNSGLKENIYIDFTMNSMNAHTLENVISEVYNLNIKNFVISPYLTNSIENDSLYLKSDYIASKMRKLIDGQLIDFSEFNDLNIFFKSDCFVGNTIVDQLIDKDVINLDRLYIDDYGVLFNKYACGSNLIKFNYPILSDTAIRISHDGFVGNCFDMFYDDFSERAFGNIREQGIRSILENVNVHKASLAV